MNERKNRIGKVIMSIILAAFMVAGMLFSPPSTVTAAGSPKIKIVFPASLSEVPDKAIQSMAFVEDTNNMPTEIYLTIRDGSTTVIVKCTVSSSTSSDYSYVATASSYIKCSLFGHGESLEVVKENGNTYLWLGSGADTGTDYCWSTKISCIKYNEPSSSSSSRIGSYDMVYTFTVDKDGGVQQVSTNEATTYNPDRVYGRVSFAFSTASICIREANSTESKYMYYNNISGGLTNDKIKNALLATTNKAVSTVAESVDCTYSDGVYSYQSHDIYNGTLFVAGGRANGVANIKRLYASTGKVAKDAVVINNVIGSRTVEMEGIKVNSKYIFYLLNPELNSSENINKTDTYIYWIALQA